MKNSSTRKGLNIYFPLIFLIFIFTSLATLPGSAQGQNNATGYPELIQQADQALASKDYPSALMFYAKATNAKPELKYASGKIKEINAILDANQDLRPQLFENLIINAETLYRAKSYALAKMEYQKALGIDPKAQFPKDRLSQISAVYTDPSDIAFFNDAVATADRALAESDYEKAVLFYETALSVKPDAKNIKDKIASTKKQQADAKVRAEQSAKIIAAADKLLQDEKRAEAKAEYQKALEIMPENLYAKNKIRDIDNFLNDKKALQETYDKVIEQADKFYINRDFATARLKYQEALKTKPDARYPKDMIEKAKAGESQLQSDQQKYDAALASAENLLKISDYDGALSAFKSALAVNPSETYPKTKITEIEKLLVDRTSRREAYDIAIKNGDQTLNEKKYSSALSHFRNALTLLPDEKYPAQKIEEINAMLVQLAAIDEDYKKAVADADKHFGQKKYTEAIVSYTQALDLKPGEAYPQQRITEAQSQIDMARSQDEKYASAIAAADKSLGEKKYETALLEYKQALSVKPNEKYPADKSDEINKILSQLKSQSENYSLAIASGDKALAASNFSQALTSYQDALNIKPADKYATDKIAEVNGALAAQQKIDEQYTTAINTGDQLFAANDYDLAVAAYTEAASLKKTEKYPQDQLTLINKLLADLRSADETYSKAITEGDNNFKNQKLTEAKASYTNASSIKPAEAYPKTRIAEINTLLAEKAKMEGEYESAITAANLQFDNQQYTESIEGYRKALVLKPSEKYPKDKIAEAEKLISQMKELQKSYDKAIAEGEKQLKDKDYPKSMASFGSAVELKPAETYPKQKIAEIQAILDKDKAEGQRYQDAITVADKLFTDKAYSEAISNYQLASGIKPAEKYPQDQVSLINKLIADQKKLDEDYLKLITDADVQLKSGKYDEARKMFVDAGKLKPAENLPKDKIAEIDGLLADIRNRDESFTKYISEGDLNLSATKYTEALASYNSALKLKPEEAYPQAQIDKTNKLIADQKILDDNFLAAIEAADNYFGINKYTEAIADYRKALALKPTEKYPSDKIAESQKLIDDLKLLNEAYAKAIASGDKKLSGKDYENALADFKSANTLKPSEEYPTLKIKEIQAILDKNKAEADRYNEAIALADKFFTAEKYLDALEPYQRAVTIKPGEKYPADQIVRINKLLDELAKLDAAYQKLITDAEAKFKTNMYADARKAYAEAALMKPSESLPKEKIAEIDGILAGIKLRDENYTKAINDAANEYAGKNLVSAVKLYESALTIKPEEKHPQERITAIKAEIKAIDDRYNKAVGLGDDKLASKNLMEALNAYQDALEIKPAEEYPKTKIAEINLALAAQKEEQEKLFASYIADGDRLFAVKDYKGARSAFTKATGIKPAETYPKQRITEINKLIEALELAFRAEYNKALGEADKLYNTKIYDLAIDAYEAASVINPDDPYPQQQISKIRKYMADHAIQDLYSQPLVISEGNEKKFTFPAVEQRLRKNNYILLKARSTGSSAPKVYLNYGKDGLKNGGIVLRSIDKKDISDFLIRISVQDKWYREDNNWITLFVETGEIEITKVQIAAGDD